MTSVNEYRCPNGIVIAFDKRSGQIIKLVDPLTKISWASPEHGLGKFQYMTYNQTDFDTFDKAYTFIYGHGSVGIFKPNITKNAHPASKGWEISYVKLFKRKDEGMLVPNFSKYPPTSGMYLQKDTLFHFSGKEI
jgi:hypothetical protein